MTITRTRAGQFVIRCERCGVVGTAWYGIAALVGAYSHQCPGPGSSSLPSEG